MKEEILKNCQSNYNKQITDHVIKQINTIYKTTINTSSHQYNKNNEVAQPQQTTTGFNFEGYTITSYLGIVSGQTVLGTGFLSEFKASFSDFFGVQSDAFADKLEEAKQAAMKK